MTAQRTHRRGGLAVKAVIVLGCICLGSGLGVGVLYHAMKDDILENAGKAFRSALQTVLGEAGDYATIGDAEEPGGKVYVDASSPSAVLYAAMGSAKGYQSTVKVLVSVEGGTPGTPVGDDPLIHAVAVVESAETPGLGDNIRAVLKDVSLWGALAGEKPTPGRPAFQAQFSGKRLSDLVVVKRADTDKIAAITGATITSKAATKAVRNAVRKIIEATAEVHGR